MRCALQFEVKEAPRLTTRAKPSATVAAAAAEKPAPRKRLSYRVERSSKAPAKAALPKATPTPLVAKALATKAKREAVAAGTVATQTRRAAPARVSRKANDDNAVGSFVELSIGVVWAFFFVDSRASSARNE